MAETSREPVCHGPWTPAGTLQLDPSWPAPAISVFAFGGPDGVLEKSDVSLDWLAENRQRYTVIWINVEGLGDAAVLTGLGEMFGLHSLSLEDVTHLKQRPKLESYSTYHYIVLRMLSRPGGREEIEAEQLSLFLGYNFVLTFQEGLPGDCFGPLRARLRSDPLSRHEHIASFLAYSLIDCVVDSYFPILEDLGETLEDLEEFVLADPNEEVMQRIHEIKRQLLVIRRAVWPLREALNPLFHDSSELICAETKLFLRDAHDHCIQVIELVETYREIGASLMDVHLSTLSNKMNEVMKVLTIMTTIFVPLTFIAGVYGMNFNTARSPVNMPELNWYWGYPLCLMVMLLVAGLELWALYKRGWILPKRPKKPKS